MATHRPLDRRAPLVLDIQELQRRPGTMRELNLVVPAPADLGIEVIGVPTESDIQLDLKLEAVVEGVLVSGTATAQTRGECVRCLTELTAEQSFELQELYFYPGNELAEEDSLVIEEAVDLEPALRDAVVLELPFAPLCKPDCNGLCPECGVDLNKQPEHSHEPSIDPRWGKLAELDVNPEN